MHFTRQHPSQRGLSLLVVIVILMLTLLMALGASRTALFNTLIVGNEADYQRTFDAAQALLQDAELDILGQDAAGHACAPSASDGKVCRRLGRVWFIDEEKDLTGLLALLQAQPGAPCLQGICARLTGTHDFWDDAALFARMRQAGVAARYGEFTGAQSGHHSHPLLNTMAANESGWYWVEVLPYAMGESRLLTPSASTSASTTATAPLSLHLNPAVVYRITAIAQGLKPGTLVVLQSTLARQKIKD